MTGLYAFAAPTRPACCCTSRRERHDRRTTSTTSASTRSRPPGAAAQHDGPVVDLRDRHDRGLGRRARARRSSRPRRTSAHGQLQPAHDQPHGGLPRPELQRHERDVQRLALPGLAVGQAPAGIAGDPAARQPAAQRRDRHDLPHRHRQHHRHAGRVGAPGHELRRRRWPTARSSCTSSRRLRWPRSTSTTSRSRTCRRRRSSRTSRRSRTSWPTSSPWARRSPTWRSPASTATC